MKNNKQLLNKENWIKYLDVAQENDLTNNAIANDIVSNIERVLGERVSVERELLAKYTKWQNEVIYNSEAEMYSDIDKFLNNNTMTQENKTQALIQIHNTLDNAIKRLEELIKK